MRTKMIHGYLAQLTKSFNPLPPVDDDQLTKLHRAKDYTGMAAFIRGTMKVVCRLRVGIVRSGGLSAPGWVNVPDPMPMYGTKEHKEATITMYLRRDFIECAPLEPIVYVIAHEMSHIILDSVQHPLHKEEEAVDLTAMLLGYRDFVVTGCTHNTEFTNHRVGYLTRDEVNYAARYMTIGR